MDRIYRIDVKTRRALRSVLGGFERDVPLGALAQVIQNGDLHQDLRHSAREEMRRRIFVGTVSLAYRLGGAEYTVRESLVDLQNPFSSLGDDGDLFLSGHASRADVWVKLDVVKPVAKNRLFATWLSNVLHYAVMIMEFETIRRLGESRFVEAMHMNKAFVLAGFRRPPDATNVNLPPGHELFATSFMHVVKTFVPHCRTCGHGVPDADKTLRCPGLDHRRPFVQADRLVSESEGCPFFWEKERHERLIGDSK